MSIIDWLSSSSGKFIFTDSQKTQHRLTLEQYGAACVAWAVVNTSNQLSEVDLFARVKNSSDILNKISAVPLMAASHITAFFCSVYSSYAVIRLQVPSEEFKKLTKGMARAVIDITHPKYPLDHLYRKALLDQIGKSTALILQAAGEHMDSDDKLTLGIGAAMQYLLFTLKNDYEEISLPDKEAIPPTKSGARIDSTFINPAVEATRNMDSEKLLMSRIWNTAIDWVEHTDAKKSLIYS